MNDSPKKYPQAVFLNLKSKNFVAFTEDNVRVLNTEIFGTVFFGFSSYINSGIIRSYCEIGRYCSIGRNVSIGLGSHDTTCLSTSPFLSHLSLGESLKLATHTPKRRVIIGHDVWIGDNVCIASGVKIGHGSVIAAGSVVTKDVQPYTIVGGVPAKMIKKRFDDDISSTLLSLEWWNINPSELQKIPKDDLVETILFIKNLDLKEHQFPINYTRVDGNKIS